LHAALLPEQSVGREGIRGNGARTYTPSGEPPGWRCMPPPGKRSSPQPSHQPSPLPRLSHVRRGPIRGGWGKAAFSKTPHPKTESHLDLNLPVFPASPGRLRPLLRRGGGASAGDGVEGPEIARNLPPEFATGICHRNLQKGGSLPHHSGVRDNDEAIGFQNPGIGWFAGFHLTALISLLVD
jgi:hypothetical protein